MAKNPRTLSFINNLMNGVFFEKNETEGSNEGLLMIITNNNNIQYCNFSL